VPTLLLITLVLLVLAAVAGGIYLAYRSSLRYAKNIERGLKIVTLIVHLPPSSEDIEVGGRDVRDVVEEKLSQTETLYNVLSSTTQKGFMSRLYGQRHFSMEIVATKGLVHYYIAAPYTMIGVLEQAVLSAYPTANVEQTTEHNIFNPVGKIGATVGGEMHLKKEFGYPIATFRDTRRDVMQSILNALSNLSDQDGAAIQILMRPASSGWDKIAKGLAEGKKKNNPKKGGIGGVVNPKELASAFWKAPEAKDGGKDESKPLSNLDQTIVDAIEQKTRYPGYEVLIRIVASSNVRERAQVIVHNLVATFSLFDSPSLNGFKFTTAKDMESFVTSFILRSFPLQQNKDILNSIELATIFHFPDLQFTSTSQLKRQDSKQVDGPRNIAGNGLLLGYNVFRGIKKEIRLSQEDRRRHTYIVGQTGTGKSQLLKSLAVQDMYDGNGFAFIDPHGDAVEDLLAMVPKERTEDVIYFNPADMEHPLGLNLFEHQTAAQKDFLIQEAINMLYKLYDPQRQGIMGPRYEHLFRNAALTVMADPAGGTFIDIPKLFTDPQYVQYKLQYVTDQTVKDFWNKEMRDAQRSNEFGEVKSWFVSKFGAFLLNTMMRNIIGQTKSSLDLRQIMDNKKILLVNLSKGQVGELNSKLLGMIFVMKFQAAAMSRSDIADENQRQDFCLYVDEFQNFSTDSFATILSEARKYRLNLIVANQFISQLSDEIRDAVFGNVGSAVSLRCSPNDAEFLTKQFSPAFDALDLVNLPNFNGIARIMVEGVPSQPFSMMTMTTFGDNKKPVNPQLREALRQLSAAKYGKPRQAVEKDINKRFETLPPPPAPLSSPRTPYGPSSLEPPYRPAAGNPPTSSQSFLDEWLAKRRPGVASRPLQTPSAPPNPAPAPTATHEASRAPDESNPPSGSAIASNAHHYIAPAAQTPNKGSSPYPPANTDSPYGLSEEEGSPLLIPETESKLSTEHKTLQPLPHVPPPISPAETGALAASSLTSPALVSLPTVATEETSFEPTTSSQTPPASPPTQPDTTPERTTSPSSASVAPEEKPLTEAERIAQLKPGEIFIDSNGTMHQGA
jgi:hypothetical protein